MIKTPRLIITSISSSSGKSAIDGAIIGALLEKNYNLTSFKCGPDYIDPLIIQKIFGIPTYNLDLFFVPSSALNIFLGKKANESDLSIIEGAMGYYDGLSFSEKYSVYDMAVKTGTPSVLVVDVKGMAYTSVSVIKGMVTFKNDSMIKGVILNKCSENLYIKLSKIIEKECGTKVLGYMPYIKNCETRSRHLGLDIYTNRNELKKNYEILKNQALKSIDLNSLIEIAKSAKPLPKFPQNILKEKKVNIAVAYDESFCFYYKENLEILEELGANIIKFSPINDKTLPSDVHGIYIGGGYPELYGKELSENKTMLESLKTSYKNQIPIFAEGGGFIYLHETMEDVNKNIYKMVGIIKGHCYKTDRLQNFGYIKITGKKDTMLLDENESINAHEFHYWNSSNSGDSCTATKIDSNNNWDCIVCEEKNLFAGFPQLYFLNNKKIAEKFIFTAKIYKTNNK